VTFLYLIPAAGAVLAIAAGRLRRHAADGPVASRFDLAAIAVISVAVGLLAFGNKAADVMSHRALSGAALAAVLSLIPLAGYYLLGARVRSGAAVVFVLLTTLGPLYAYSLVGLLWVVDLTACTPDAYECPL